jgi:hypothetical protein
MTGDRHRQGFMSSRIARLASVVGVFALVGPPVGGLAAWATMGMSSMRSPLPFLIGSYGEGLVLAVAAGALVGAAALWLGKTSWMVPVMVAVAVNATMLVVDAATRTIKPDLITGSLRVAHVFLPASLLATLVCWWLTRPLLRSA